MAEIGAHNANRLFVSDKTNHKEFLVDTGANISVVPPTNRKRATPCDLILYAANGSKIKTYGEQTLSLNLGLKRQFKWTFVVADVSRPILGADFLRHHKLMIDLHSRKLIDKITQATTKAHVTNCDQPSISTTDSTTSYHDILAEFPDITSPSVYKEAAKHNVRHHITTNGPPVWSRPRPLNPEQFRAAKAEFERMMDLGICRPSNSSWCSPLHMVVKKNGELRPCGDYRRLNAATKPDRYPIPRLQDFTYILENKQIFSTIDLRRAYHLIPMAEEDIQKTAVITPFGLFEFPVMNFGLCGAGQTFQRYINNALRGLDFVFPYLDDILVASENEEQHRHHLRALFERLDKFGCKINPSKCNLGKNTVHFLGYLVTKDGIRPPTEKTDAIMKFPLPKTISELRRFLGMINFYRACLPSAAEQQDILNKYLHNTKKNDKTPIEWTPKSIAAFEHCKVSIHNATTIAHPSCSAPLAIFSDASDTCVGAVLQQNVNGKWTPLGFFSKSLSTAQQKYSAYDKELTAIYMAMQHFRRLVEGRRLTVYTDHKPLVYAWNHIGTKNNATPRRTRQLEFIGQFTTDFQYIKGNENTVADCLSRVEMISCPSPLNYKEISEAQQNNEELKMMQKQTNLNIKKLKDPLSDTEIYCEISTGRARPYIPEPYRQQIFDTVHGLSHPGVRTTRKLLAKSYFWPGMNTDAADWARSCLSCQRAKVHRHIKSPLGQFPPAPRLEHVHIDVVGPLPISENARFIITMIDRFTRWPEAYPVADASAETTARTFYDGWISRYGTPATITTDQGRNFESKLFTNLARLMGIKKIHTTSYHPQSNGLVERWHRSMKAALMARCNTLHWASELSTILLGLRTALREDTGTSAAEILYGTSLRLPGEFYVTSQSEPDESEYVQKLRHVMKAMRPAPTTPHTENRSTFVSKDLATCSHVFVRNDAVRKPLSPPYDGPYPVILRNEKTYTLKLPTRTTVINIDRLKPAHILCEDTATRSGRIVKKPQRYAAQINSYTGGEHCGGACSDSFRPRALQM